MEIYDNTLHKDQPKSMKIAIIADVLGAENNGTTITVKRLINNLKARGHEVEVVSPSDPQEAGYFQVPKIDFKIFNKYVEKNGVELAKPDKELLRRVIAGCDVVHILMPFAMGRAAIRIANELQKPVTTAFHVQPENVSSHFGLQRSKAVNELIYKRFYEQFYRYTEYIHCPTRFIADKLAAHGYDADLRVISNGVDPVFKAKQIRRPAQYADKFCILTTGRLSKEKCQKDLIEGVRRSKYADGIQIFIAGDGPLKNRLARRGAKLKNPPVISFYAKEDLVNLINCCDLYVHPSYAEIESIACVEAITCGLVPVIADSEMSAAKYFALTEHDLYASGDPDSLAQKIDFMIEHPTLRAELRQRYIEYAERFRIEKCIGQMIEMFEDAVARRHPQPRKEQETTTA